MAHDLQAVRGGPLAMISSPDLRRLRKISLGTVEWPGQRPRKYLSGGSTLTDSDRARAEELLRALRGQITSTDAVDAERFAIITNLLLTYPIANATAATGKARGEAYREALSDVPPEVVSAAVRAWNRGEAGDHDYRWAPAPAVLRTICNRINAPIADAIHDLETLLGAVSIDRAMDPRPLEAEVSPIAAAIRRVIG